MGAQRRSGGLRVVLTGGDGGRAGLAPGSPRRSPDDRGPIVRVLRRGLSPVQMAIIVIGLVLLGSSVFLLIRNAGAEAHRRKVAERYQERVNQGLIDLTDEDE